MITGNFLQHAQNLEVRASTTLAAQTHPLAAQGSPRTSLNVLIPPTRRRALRRAHSAYRCHQDESADTEKRLRTATEIRDSIEIVHTSEYANFLKAFFPVFNKILQHGSAKFEDCPEQKLRNVLLEILNRLPHNETLRQYVADLLTLSMHILNTDNEENSLICLRIIFDLHKNYRPTLDAYAQPFLNFVRTLYTDFQGMVGAPASASPFSLSPCPAANATNTEPHSAPVGGSQSRDSTYCATRRISTRRICGERRGAHLDIVSAGVGGLLLLALLALLPLLGGLHELHQALWKKTHFSFSPATQL